MELFAELPDQIKSAGEPGALPLLEGKPTRRNVTGVCDEPQLVDRFTKIASAVKANAKMDGVLHNIQLAPQGMLNMYIATQKRYKSRSVLFLVTPSTTLTMSKPTFHTQPGVICLLHPMNNTEDFADGKTYLDNTGAWGIDLLNDSFHRYIARESLKGDEVGIVGPRTLTQCSTCGLYFIIRLPVVSRTHFIEVDGEIVPRYPTQLFEAFSYLALFLLFRCFTVFKNDSQSLDLHPGFQRSSNQYG